MRTLEHIISRALAVTALASIAAGCQLSSDEAEPEPTGAAEATSEAPSDEAATSGEDDGNVASAAPEAQEPAPSRAPGGEQDGDGMWGTWDPANDVAALQGTWQGPDGAVWTFEGTSGTVTTDRGTTAVELELRSPVALTLSDPEAGSAVTHSFTRNDDQMWAGRGRSARRIGDRVVVYEGRYTLVFADGVCTPWQLRFGEWSAADAAFACEDSGDSFRYGTVTDEGTQWGNTITFDGSAGRDLQLDRAALTAMSD